MSATAKKRVSCVFGTRPEAIKLCPLLRALRDHGSFEAEACVTGQHRQMLDQALAAFGVTPDKDLALMRPNQTLGGLTGRAIAACEEHFAATRPDLVIVQGDTTTVLAASLAAFYCRIAVAHVEAGLRTGDKRAPFPEEINRVVASRLADYHFAPTSRARDNLLAEGVPPETIFVTGNTVIDALFLAVERVRREPPAIGGLPDGYLADRSRKVVLVTGHRRENFGRGFEAICRGIAELAARYPAVDFVYPVHLNPNVREPVGRLLGGRDNVRLIEPLGYLPFVALLDRAWIVLTDSGGVQEEAPSLGKPALVMRDATERPEAIAAGTARLVGADAAAIVAGASRLLDDPAEHARMARAANPYGDGRASGRIVAALETILLDQRETAESAVGLRRAA